MLHARLPPHPIEEYRVPAYPTACPTLDSARASWKDIVERHAKQLEHVEQATMGHHRAADLSVDVVVDVAHRYF